MTDLLGRRFDGAIRRRRRDAPEERERGKIKEGKGRKVDKKGEVGREEKAERK